MAAKKAPVHELSSKMPKTAPIRIAGEGEPTGEWEDGKYYLLQYMGHMVPKKNERTGEETQEEIVTSSERTGDYRQSDLFVFVDNDGGEWELPILDHLTVDTSVWLESLERARMGYITANLELIRRCNADAATAITDTGMTRSRLEQVSAMWTRAGDVTLGESTASDDS